MTSPPAGQRGHGSEAVLRNQPVRIVNGRIEGRYTDVYELICPGCGDNPDLDYSEVSPRLQRLRGPYKLEAALAAFHKHQGSPWRTASVETPASWLGNGQDHEPDNER